MSNVRTWTEDDAPDIRASDLREGDRYMEPGMFDTIKIASLDQHGDTMIVDGTEGEEDTLDIDTVVWLFERKKKEPA